MRLVVGASDTLPNAQPAFPAMTGFMQGHAAALPIWLAAPLLWQAVFMRGRAGFRGSPPSGALREIGFIVTGGDSHITVRATTRMVGDVEAAPDGKPNITASSCPSCCCRSTGTTLQA